VGKKGKGDGRVNLNNAKCKAIQNCHNESPLSRYMLMKMKKEVLHNEGKISRIKRQHTEWENIFAICLLDK
jgi:hypothetical protein